MVDVVVSYSSNGLRYDPYAEIQNICHTNRYKLMERGKIGLQDYASADLILLVGWQWMLKEVDQRFVVFHDSLLPELRGFSPTVTALIAGKSETGITAFSPAGSLEYFADTGPVFGQEKLQIAYPITIRAVYEKLGFAYCRLADRVLQAAAAGPLAFSEQDAAKATYSVWRNEDDYRIDWASSAEQIQRFVDAVGWPYLGAKTTIDGRDIRVDRVEICPDLAFGIRGPGKFWSIGDGMPMVICGSGMLRIVEARETDGSPVKFTSLRVRST
jgi:methionyl-tRNA formyltransferase